MQLGPFFYAVHVFVIETTQKDWPGLGSSDPTDKEVTEEAEGHKFTVINPLRVPLLFNDTLGAGTLAPASQYLPRFRP